MSDEERRRQQAAQLVLDLLSRGQIQLHGLGTFLEAVQDVELFMRHGTMPARWGAGSAGGTA